MQWQHGEYTVFGNGTLILTPIAVDGRQLLSDPCREEAGQYTRFNTTEEFKVRLSVVFSHPAHSDSTQEFSVDIDKFNRIKRLDLTRVDGSLLHPMFLAYQPPKMLPTTTLNPMPTGHNQKRELSSKSGLQPIAREQLINPDRWWWLGVLMTSLGGVAFFCS